jgi:hypothetical protein
MRVASRCVVPATAISYVEAAQHLEHLGLAHGSAGRLR